MSNSIDQATYDFYQSQAPHFSLNPAISHSRHLDDFLDRLQKGARILELGCGAGRDTVRIRERGFDLDATDGVPAMIAKANERHGADASLMRFDELVAVSRYDAVWAHACLLHCPRAQLRAILNRIHQALEPDGLHYASYKLGEGEANSDGRDLLGRLHNFPSAEWLFHTYKTANFDVLDCDIFAGKGSDGTQRNWLALTVIKR